MTLPERGLYLVGEAMKLEIDDLRKQINKLKTERDQLVALAKFGKWCLSSDEQEFDNTALYAKAEEFGLIGLDAYGQQDETQLAELSENLK